MNGNGQPMLLSPQEAMQRFPQLRQQIQQMGNKAAIPPGGQVIVPPQNAEPPRQAGPVDFLVKAYQATGDAVMLITAVSHVKRHYGNRFRFGIETNFPELLQNNPWYTQKDDLFNPIEIEAGQCWQWINERSDHLIQEWIRGLVDQMSQKLGFKVEEPRMKDFRPAIYLSEEEKMKSVRDIVGDDEPYWVIDAGWKSDYTAKQVPTETFQEVVNQLQGKVRFVQMGRELTKGCADDHPPLKGVINAIGKTEDRRDLLRLIYRSSGVLSPISFPVHACAGLPMPNGRLRPCVVVAGGRESVSMIGYPGHTVMSTIGKLDCCARGACLKVKVEDKPDDTKGPSQERCLRPDRGVATCMRMITPDQIVVAIESYLTPPEPPRICIATLADGDGEWVKLSRLTFPNKRAYAEKHGYGFVAETQVFHEKGGDGKDKPDRPAPWTKIPLILRLMSEYNWIFWTDADAVITNPEIKLESLIGEDCDFIVGSDQNGMNTGHFLIKSTEESWRFLRESWEREHLTNDGCFEQAAMGEWLRANVAHFEKKTKGDKPPAMDRLTMKVVDQRVMNSYPNNWQPGDFVLHAPRDERWKDKEKALRTAIECAKNNVSMSTSTSTTNSTATTTVKGAKRDRRKIHPDEAGEPK